MTDHPSPVPSCCAPAPDRSGRSCDKPKGHDGEHWTYGGSGLRWASPVPSQDRIAEIRQQFGHGGFTESNREHRTHISRFRCGVCDAVSSAAHDSDCPWAHVRDLLSEVDRLLAENARLQGMYDRLLESAREGTVRTDTAEAALDKAEDERDELRAQLAQAEQETLIVNGDTSDGWHTFNELYEYRKAYNALLFNEWACKKLNEVHKSWRHSDGELCFGGGWFVAVAQTPVGQISNHYEAADWDLFQIPERERGAEWDGHTPAVALSRLLKLSRIPSQAEADRTTLQERLTRLENALEKIAALEPFVKWSRFDERLARELQDIAKSALSPAEDAR